VEWVVLLHGFAGTARCWDEVLTQLPGERYRSLALDLPGHGSLGERADAEGARSDAAGAIDFDGCVESVLARARLSALPCADTRSEAGSRCMWRLPHPSV
jgi:alpha-beta hydrolase superfamily lysophospholipase